MKHTVILGTGGRVGAAMARAYAAAGDRVTGFNRQQLDLARPERVRDTLRSLSFDALVNCAAVTSPDYCEKNDAEAFLVNETAVGIMAAECRRKGARFIHLSTDYVFGGHEPGLRSESDPTGPVNIYGRSKLAGEALALASSEGKYEPLIARVSWVFGQDRPGFVEQVLQGAVEGKPLEAVTDKWSMPTSVDDLNALLRPFLYDLTEGGVLHVTQSGAPCSWYDYGMQVLESARAAGWPIGEAIITPRRLDEIPFFIAHRPAHTAMSTERLTKLTGITPRPWQEALGEYVRRFPVPPKP